MHLHVVWSSPEYNMGKCQISLILVQKPGLGISSKSLIFCERKSEKVIHWLKRANRSHLSFVKSNESECSRLLFCKEWQEPFALGRRAMGAIRFWHKKGKSSGKLSKTYKKYDFVKQIACFLWAKERLSREKEQITWVALLFCLWSLFFKEQWEQIAYSQSLKCATLSKRPKSKRVNSQPWFLIYLLCFLLESFLKSCAWSQKCCKPI